MTRVSRFSGLSVFSSLNNLCDITMDVEFSSICVYPQDELENNFKEYIKIVIENVLSGFAVVDIETTALLFQTGYLT